MPELPEVARAVKDIKKAAAGSKITLVETTPDDIVFAGTSNETFAAEITGRSLKDVKRYGKVFYFELYGEGKLPVFHFGMTGAIHVRGQESFKYKEGPKASTTQWPPKYMKFIIHFENSRGEPTEIAFTDPRRLGRIRLCSDPLKEAPIVDLGFDPVLCMPSFEDFKPMILRRSCPIKSLLLDQSVFAGVGNWVGDEILYNSRIHPEQRCNALTEEQLRNLHHNTSDVCCTAVAVDADSSRFPSHWLFNHRWGKGKREHSLKLPDGKFATIKWVTVGGRTSAFVFELQVLTPGGKIVNGRGKRKQKTADSEPEDAKSDSDLTSISDLERNVGGKGSPKKARKRARRS